MKYNPIDNYSMEQIEEMLKNVMEIEEYGTEGKYLIEIMDDFEDISIDLDIPLEPTSASFEENIASQRK
jgi:hypothetical protein